MTDTELHFMIERMQAYGGSFVVALGNALQCADKKNKQRLIDAFPDYVNEYGENGKFNAEILVV